MNSLICPSPVLFLTFFPPPEETIYFSFWFVLFVWIGLSYCQNKILLFLAVWGLNKNEIILHSFFSDLLSLLNIVSLRIPLDMVHSLSFHLRFPVLVEQLSFLLLMDMWVFSITDNATTINTLLCDSKCTVPRFSLECVAVAGISRCWECAYSILLLSTLVFPQVSVLFPALPCRVEPPLLCIFSNTWFCRLSDLCQMSEYEVVSL